MLLSLAALGLLGPFATDIYLPALPNMAEAFGVHMGVIQLTLSACTIGMAIGQFVLGSLSDITGRRLILIVGGIAMTVASLAGAIAPSAWLLIVLCFLMGLGAAGGIVGGRAVVADLVHGEAAARPFTILGMLVSIGPVIAPITGTIILEVLGDWRAIFIGMAVLAAIGTVLVALNVPETHAHENRHQGGLPALMANAGKILVNRQYITHAIVLWLGFGLMFAYISSSSFIVQENLNLSPTQYSFSFGANGIGLITTSWITARLVKKYRPGRVMLIGVFGQLIAVVALLVVIFSGTVTVWTVLPLLFILAASMGFIFGPVTALAMIEVRFAAGTAIALLGSIQFLAAAVSTATVGFISNNALVSLTTIGCVVELLMFGILGLNFLLERRRAVTR